MFKIQKRQPKATSHMLFPQVFVKFELRKFKFVSIIFELDFYKTLQ